MTKLKRQMSGAGAPAQLLMAEMMWALLLFLSETRIAAQQLKIPRDYLELDRDL